MSAVTPISVGQRDARLAPVESGLVRKLLDGQFALTAELPAPADGSAEAIVRQAEGLRDVVDALNVTGAAGARVRMSALAASILLRQAGHEPVLQLTCRDQNRIALQGELLGAGAAGLHHVLLLTGNDPAHGDEPAAKPVFDLPSAQLIRIAAQLRDHGTLASGRSVLHPPRLFVGVTDSPTPYLSETRMSALRNKARAGAQFIQTRFCFDSSLVRNYMHSMRNAGITAQMFVLIGVGVLRSVQAALWMRDNFPGVSIPDELISRLGRAKDAEAEGVRIAAELLQELAEIPDVAGAHLMVPGNVDGVFKAITRSGLRAS